MPEKSPSPEFIKLPPLEIRPIRKSIGHIKHVLRPGSLIEIASVSEFSVSSRVKFPLYELENGEKLLIADKKKIARPAGVDGILFKSPTGELSWVSHAKLDSANGNGSTAGTSGVHDAIRSSWRDKFFFKREETDSAGNTLSTGLRPPQIGGLHAIGSHWSLQKTPATLVMPTGTGKTETMLATLAAFDPGRLLVVVPSKVLRDQMANKFLTFGLLRALGNLPDSALNPVVGVITRRPKSLADLAIIDESQVIVSTMNALVGVEDDAVVRSLATKIDTLIVDEAHHVAAPTWSKFKELFQDKPILQFTATPYRRDGKVVDGRVIYQYPLAAAQRDGYFKKISFNPVYEIDTDRGDEAIARSALSQLRKDIDSGYDHILMARCSSKKRAEFLFEIYKRLAPEFDPVLVHSEEKSSSASLTKLTSLKSRVVVCVDMLGEGFDLPQLKIAAVHDTHKSLGVLLQFTGRFTRSAGANLGDATVIANISDPNVSSALEQLYSEDADWNKLLNEFSSEASKSHKELTDFLNSSDRLDEEDDDEPTKISHNLLTPPLSSLFFDASTFKPNDFHKAIPSYVSVAAVWLHAASKTLYFVTRMQPSIRWTRARDLKDRQWDLYVLHFDEKNRILALASTDKSSTHSNLAAAVGAGEIISGDVIFRCLGGINRLRFQNLGVKKHGRRNLRYAMYTGADVAEALTLAEKAGSVKSNLSGNGWEDGAQRTIGCSYKGRVWYPDEGTIPELIRWFEEMGTKLRDESIDTKDIIANVLIPEEIEELPDKQPLSLEWPAEILRLSDERVVVVKDGKEFPLYDLEIALRLYDRGTNTVTFEIFSETVSPIATLKMSIGAAFGFRVTADKPNAVLIRVGRLEAPIEEYFSNYPPLLRFVDLSELDGNLLISPKNVQELEYPEERFEVWDWTGVDINTESIWKNGAKRPDSIQGFVADHYVGGGFDFVFDDDDSGEAADLVCLKEEADHIRLALVHCKFTTGGSPGKRVSDVVEVCSQALRSSKWNWKFKDLGRHLTSRENDTQKAAVRDSRIMKGRMSDINRFLKMNRFKPVRTEILIAQPGLSKANCTNDQKAVLAAAHNFLKETIGVDLDIICSA